MRRHDSRVRSLVVGGSGLVGGALLRLLGPDAVGTYRNRPVDGLRQLDVRDSEALRSLIREVAPSVVFYPAAEPNVDWCELHPDESWAANVAPALVAIEASRTVNANLVFFSTDYVFDGREGPYDEQSTIGPLSVYGRQKVEVEERVIEAGCTVVRTTTVFGEELPPGKNFVLRLVARLRARGEATIPDDQFATPTWSDDLATGAVAASSDPGVWHVAGPDFMARDEFARLIAEVFDCDVSLIRSVSTEALRQAALRPMRGGLRTDKIRQSKGIHFSSTRDALIRLRQQLSASAGLKA
jgi:dTDP-4-dehydrorhamnose reductase